MLKLFKKGIGGHPSRSGRTLINFILLLAIFSMLAGVSGGDYIYDLTSGISANAATPVPTPTIAWIRQFGSSGEDRAYGIGVDSSGNVYAAGYTYGTLPGEAPSGGLDAFICKYGGSGSVLWIRQFGTSSNDYAWSVAVNSSGSAYVAGTTSGIFTEQTTLGGADAYIRQYDSSGSALWTRQFGSSSDDIAYGIAADSSGNAYVAGCTYGTLPDQTYSGGVDAFIRKYDKLRECPVDTPVRFKQ